MKTPELRKPVAAGQFYPQNSAEIKKQIRGFLHKELVKNKAVGCILPHAGYIYSGAVASQTVASIEIKDNIILLGPNHTGYGENFSIMASGKWETPLGQIEINSRLAECLLNKSGLLKEDIQAHLYEHSLEVELPILQYFKPDFSIVPIIISEQNFTKLQALGQDIAAAIKASEFNGSVMLLASSDMTHYESQKSAQIKDQEAIKAILALDEEKLAKKVSELNISMCGVAPVIVMLVAAKLLGAKTAKLINYRTSADASNDFTSVVGYAGITIG